MLAEALGAPALRFVEKGGKSLVSMVGQTDPWKSDQFCERRGCLPCATMLIICKEKEERAATMIAGEKIEENGPYKEASKTLPGCTTEGVVYVIDCQTCRKNGRTR